jgi:hypothetical protein
MRTEELIDRANENARRAASIVWPEITGLADYPQNLEELAGIEFDGIPEFRGDGIGVGTPEFRENLEGTFTRLMLPSNTLSWCLAFREANSWRLPKP